MVMCVGLVCFEILFEVLIESLGINDDWNKHTLMELVVDMLFVESRMLDIDAALRRCHKMITCGEAFYKTLGNQYGEEFRSLQSVWHRN